MEKLKPSTATFVTGKRKLAVYGVTVIRSNKANRTQAVKSHGLPMSFEFVVLLRMYQLPHFSNSFLAATENVKMMTKSPNFTVYGGPMVIQIE